MVNLIAFYTLLIFTYKGGAIVIQGDRYATDKYSTLEACQWAGQQAYDHYNGGIGFYWTCVPSEDELN